MYEKAKLAFTNTLIFGYHFQTSINSAFDIVSRMLFANKVNPDGSIDLKQNASVSKKELWAYIYYLFYYNSVDIPEFAAMKDSKGKANAVGFYSVVRKVVDHGTAASSDKIVPITIDGLIFFINSIVHAYGDNLVNPVFNYLQVLVKKEVLSRVMAIHVSTGDTGAMLELVTNADKIKDADIKVKFEPVS
jgi:hypothetical protein